MPVSHDQPLLDNPAYREICRFRENLLQKNPEEVARILPEVERDLFVAINDLGRSIFGEILAHLDVDVHGIVFEEERYVKRKGKTRGHYFSRFGEISVDRTTYRKRGGHGGKTIAPLELRAGFVGNSWTLEAAKTASAFMAVAPPKQAHELLCAAGCLKPSATHLDRLNKTFNGAWEAKREEFESALRKQRTVPDEKHVSLILLSKDGIMVPMKDAPREPGLKKEDTGPKGHQEVGSATISFFNARGKRMQTISCARMPEPGKVSIGAWLEQEARWAMELFPKARVHAVADGAKDNWTYFEGLSERLGVKIDNTLDYYHAMEHISKALKRYRPGDKARALKEIKKYRKILRDQPGGFQKVVQALEYRVKRSTGKVKEDIEKELAYLRRNANRMRYHRLRRKGFPIGSGIQEAACKTLVGQRLKLSGMSWRHEGGQGILTLRALSRTGQLSESWELLRPSLTRPFALDQNLKRKRYSDAA